VSVSTVDEDMAADLLALYDEALPAVYGYLLRRCTDRSIAEDLTAEVFLAAVDAVRRPAPPDLTVGWLIGTARHKLVDHWRRAEREQRRVDAVATDPVSTPPDFDWDAHLDVVVARDVLSRLGAHHRAALTLRYVDDLSVPAVADILDRTVHATEALLVRARIAFRAAYELEQEVWR
jgi:RNA polymerase sigma-70 factor (ECF subfamily)